MVNRVRAHATIALMMAVWLAACSGGGSVTVGAPNVTITAGSGNSGGNTGTPTGSGTVSGDITLLFMGNSHTAFHDVPATVAALVRALRPGKTVGVANAPGSMFLEERLNDAATMQLLASRKWSAVVLQAQKISSSGLFVYSTSEAVALSRRVRDSGATPALFAEWPRAGIAETQTIYDIYVGIAKQAPACVAPIGQAWDLALARRPSLTLHDSDGNHAAPAGAFLAAVVIAATLTGDSPRGMPDIVVSGVDSGTQAFLRGIAAEATETTSPRLWCASAPLL
jgi:hypothetical protein